MLLGKQNLVSTDKTVANDVLSLSTLDINGRRFSSGKYERHDVFGQNIAVDTTERIISPGIPSATGVADITLIDGVNGVILSFASTSANDTSAGSAARTIFIEGQDINNLTICETLSLNGLTPVNTVKTYYWVQEFGVLTTGDTSFPANSNDGIIYCGDSADTFTSGVPDTRIYLSCDINDGFSKTMTNKGNSTQRTYHTKLHISSDATANKSLTIKLFQVEDGIAFSVDKFIISSGLVQIDMSSINRYLPGGIFFITGQASSSTITMAGKLSNIQENIFD